MKFITYDLKNGRFNHRTQLGLYLKNYGFTEYSSRPDDGFYLVISPTMGSWNWFSHKNLDHLDEQILDDIRFRKAGLILTSDVHTFSTTPVYQKDTNPNIVKFIRIISNILEVNSKNVVYIDGNYKVESVLKNHNLTGFWLNNWETFLPPIDITHIKDSIFNKKSRSKKFLYFGGKAREFRLRFLNDLFKIENFKDDAYYSTGSGNYLDTETKESMYMPTIVLDDKNVGSFDEITGEKLATEYHTDSYFNIIAMSYFYLNHSQLELNEKLFKPIIALQPFIVLGEPGTLKALHDLGYKTFDRWIDESYDSELNDDIRYKKVYQEIIRLSKLNKDILNDMLLEMLPVLLHNEELKKSRHNNPSDELLNKIRNKFNHNI